MNQNSINRRRGYEAELRVTQLLSKYGQVQHLGWHNAPDIIYNGVPIEVKTAKPTTKNRVNQIQIEKDTWFAITENQEAWLLVEIRKRRKEYYLVAGRFINKLINRTPHAKTLTLTLYQVKKLSLATRLLPKTTRTRQMLELDEKLPKSKAWKTALRRLKDGKPIPRYIK